MYNLQFNYWCTNYIICTMHNGIIDKLRDTMLLLRTTLFASKKECTYIMQKKEVDKMAMTDAQKRADQKYRLTHNVITKTIAYKKADIAEGQRLVAYLDSTGQTANAYIKALVKRDLDAKGIAYPDNTEGV